MTLIAIPLGLAEANEFIEAHHRHNKPVTGWRFGVGASDAEQLWGVGVLSRPVARHLQAQGPGVAEVTRCCVRESAPRGTCSFIYRSLWRAWRAIGGTRLVTYTLQAEGGASLRGAGFTVVAEVPAATGKAWQSRTGRAWQAVTAEPKLRWELVV